MIRLAGHQREVSGEAVFNTVWVSTFLAILLALPPLAILLGLYHATDNLGLAAAAGFGVHFATLAASGRISTFLTRMLA